MRWLCQCLLVGLHFSAHLNFPVSTLSDETMQHLDIPHPNDMYGLSKRKQGKIAAGQDDPNISTFNGAGSDSTKKAALGEAAPPRRRVCWAGNGQPSTGRGAWGWGAAPPPGTYGCQNYDQNHAIGHWAFQSDQRCLMQSRRAGKYPSTETARFWPAGMQVLIRCHLCCSRVLQHPSCLSSSSPYPAPCWQAKVRRKKL